MEEYIQANKDEIEKESNGLISAGASALLIAAFFSSLRERVKLMHGTAAVIAYGGESEMNPKRWDRVAEKISSEYAYLAGFERAVQEARQSTDEILHRVSLMSDAQVENVILTTPPSQLASAVESVAGVEAGQVVTTTEPLWDTLIWGEVGSRSRMYADSIYGTHENSVRAREMDAGVLRGRRVTEGDSNVCDGCDSAASDEYVSLDELLDIGDADCLSRCRCIVEFLYEEIGPMNVERGVYAEA